MVCYGFQWIALELLSVAMALPNGNVVVGVIL